MLLLIQFWMTGLEDKITTWSSQLVPFIIPANMTIGPSSFHIGDDKVGWMDFAVHMHLKLWVCFYGFAVRFFHPLALYQGEEKMEFMYYYISALLQLSLLYYQNVLWIRDSYLSRSKWMCVQFICMLLEKQKVVCDSNYFVVTLSQWTAIIKPVTTVIVCSPLCACSM